MARQLPVVDALDRSIIDQLRIDGRMSFGEIARQVGLSETTVRQRYRRLTRLGVVEVAAMTDAVRIGELEVHLAIRVRGVPVAIVARQLARMSEIKFVASCTGPYDLITDARCSDLQHLSSLLTDRIRRVHGIAHAEALTVLEVAKDSYLWAGFRDATPSSRPVIRRDPAPDSHQGRTTNNL
ncbi:MAG: Lrp/AsnC family transcriptional regulator [Gordonia sp. (in: high G+C Gram-positive bacteria)]